MAKAKEKLSNFELMKLVSMFLILIWHFIHNTNLLDNTTGFLHLTLVFVWFFCIVHVNSFIIAMGYFQCDKKFRLSRVLSLNNSAWFYKVMSLILFTFLAIPVDGPGTLQLLSPITLYYQYWFLATYLILYCLTPFLNALMRSLTKRKFQKLFFVLFILSSLLPTITGQLFYDNQSGHSIFSFILLYYIGAYLKKYPIDKSYYFKNISENMKRLIYVGVFLGITVLNALIYHLGEELSLTGNSILTDIGNHLIMLKLGFDNPLVIVQTIVFFLWFASKPFKSNFINRIAACSFGIYLIHDNVLIRSRLYGWFYRYSYEPTFIQIYGRILLASIIVFVVCILIEMVRQAIFKKCSKTKLASSLRTKTQTYIKNLGIEVNW